MALAFFQRGIAYTDTRDYDRAIADFTEAIRHNFPDSRVYTERAAIYLDKHDFRHAIADYDEAIRLYPDANNYDGRAKAYYAKGDYDHAIADYTEALGKASDFAGIGAQLVVRNGALTVVGLIDDGGAAAAGVRANDIITAIDATPVEVRTVFEAMPRLRGSLDSQVKLTISRVGEPQPIDLIVTRRLIHLDQSESAHVLTERGKIYFAMHDYERAMADYNLAIQLDAQNADAYYYRGQARRAQGDALGGDADNVHARQLDPDVGKSASNSARGR